MNTDEQLTPRQNEVLVFISDYIDGHGYSPSHQDITDGFGWSSTQAAIDHLYHLGRKGYIEYTPRVARSIRLTGKQVVIRKQ